MEDNKDGMAWDHQMDQQRGVIQYMLDGMHRDARPRPNIDVFVVQTVRDPVQRRPMQKTVNPIKMQAAPDWNNNQRDSKPHQPAGLVKGQM